jgi:predicted amidohydrolase
MPRKVMVATVSLPRGDAPRTVESNLEVAERLLERAAAVRPDVVCLPEMFTVVNVAYDRAAQVAEPVPGPTTDRMAALARRFRTYVVCPLLIAEGGRVHNAAVLLDRRGGVGGVYRKVHPTVAELDRGVVPGERVEVFETDFGRVGVLVCFDVDFPERWREAKELGAEIVFWPSMYEGGLPLQAHARRQEYYVVSSTQVWRSVILDITGYPLAASGQLTQIASAEIDLEKRLFPTTGNLARCPAIAERYGRRVGIEVYSPEGQLTLQSHDPAVSVADLVGEFGLETYEACLERSLAAQARSRSQARRPAAETAPVWAPGRASRVGARRGAPRGPRPRRARVGRMSKRGGHDGRGVHAP